MHGDTTHTYKTMWDIHLHDYQTHFQNYVWYTSPRLPDMLTELSVIYICLVTRQCHTHLMITVDKVTAHTYGWLPNNVIFISMVTTQSNHTYFWHYVWLLLDTAYQILSGHTYSGTISCCTNSQIHIYLWALGNWESSGNDSTCTKNANSFGKILWSLDSTSQKWNGTALM